MTLQEILKAHSQTASEISPTLRDSLGDAYLLRHNELFGNIRQAAARLGYKFTNKRFADHHAFPLAALQVMLESKTIPYINNVRVLKRLCRKNKALAFDPRIALIIPNQVLHESAHACARSITKHFLAKPATGRKSSDLGKQRHQALNLLIEESFANTCDMMAWATKLKPLGKFFLQHNSYSHEPPFFKTIKWTEPKKQFYFQIVLLSFLYANFLYSSISKKEFQRACAFLQNLNGPKGYQPRAGETEKLWAIFNEGLRLSPVFRLITTEFYFKMIGLNSNLRKLLDFDFLKLFETDVRYQNTLRELSAIALTGRIYL